MYTPGDLMQVMPLNFNATKFTNSNKGNCNNKLSDNVNETLSFHKLLGITLTYLPDFKV